MRLRVLFVDDELQALEGLDRAMQPMRQRWDMVLSLGAREAMQTLISKPVDVVVTDLDMPGMDGYQLLHETMRIQPRALRIALLDTTRELPAANAAAHQYLSKPCDRKALQRVIDRAWRLRESFRSETLKNLLSRIQLLPTFPALYATLLRELQSPTVSMKKVGELISHDMGLTAKVLQLVNSAYFAFRRRIVSVNHAVNLLGLETIKPLVLGIQIFSVLDRSRVRRFSLDKIYGHSEACAELAKAIAKAEGWSPEITNQAFVSGFLHDLGKLILADNLPGDYQTILDLAGAEKIPLWKAEEAVLGATHGQIGAYLLALWGLPDPVVETLAYHHCPSECSHRDLAPLAAVHAANRLSHESRDPAPDSDDGREFLDYIYLAEVGLADRLPWWREEACRLSGQWSVTQ
jgi:HD-like signal output (HDOD) protein/CheY-like chemotaxis protein